MLFLLLLLARGHRQQRGARAAAAFLASVIGHLVYPVLLKRWPGAVWTFPILAGAAAVPGTFWLFTRELFVDGFRFRPAHGALAAAVVAANLPGSSAWTLAGKLVSIAVVLHALLGVYGGRRSDLVESRRRFRLQLVVLTGVYVITVLLGEALLLNAGERAAPDALGALATFLLVFGISFRLTRLDAGLLAAAPAEAPPVPGAVFEKLERLMREEKLYREEGLTLRVLSDRLREGEHKVRQAIHGRLGFRNFNAFLHHYRVEEACRILADPAQDHLNISEVAYQLGYRSLGPFNKAFRELTGETPTDYRKARRRPEESG